MAGKGEEHALKLGAFREFAVTRELGRELRVHFEVDLLRLFRILFVEFEADVHVAAVAVTESGTIALDLLVGSPPTSRVLHVVFWSDIDEALGRREIVSRMKVGSAFDDGCLRGRRSTGIGKAFEVERLPRDLDVGAATS